MLDEIFKDNPELLENESVKKLISHCESRFNELLIEHKKLQEDYNDILEVFVYSEIMLKDGINSKESLIKIGEILNR